MNLVKFIERDVFRIKFNLFVSDICVDFFLFYLGAFGNVKYAELKKDKEKKVAIKAMKKKEIIDSKHVDHIENEKKILEMLSHPFIVSYFSQTFNLFYFNY